MVTVAVLLAAGTSVMTLAPAALARETAGQPPARAASVVIDSVSPQIAQPGGTVVVTGTVTNRSGGTLSGLEIQLRSSAVPFSSRDALSSYASGTAGLDAPVGIPVPVRASLANGATAHWRVSLPVSTIGMARFGVYPLAAEAVDVIGMAAGSSRTFLPFWPGAAASGMTRQLKIAWVWPLIDAPHQGVCTALTSNSLTGSVAAGGRLNTLLTSGAAYAGRADLTWAVDPGLLTSVSTMTRPYQVGASTDCAGGTKYHASAAAAKWLSSLRSDTAGQQMFVTPYDDVDVAALTHEGLDNDLASAFRQGRSTAASLLGRSSGASGSPGAGGSSASGGGTERTGPQAVSAGNIAWPADGLADSSVLGNLAVNGIGTVVLDSNEMPPASTSSYTADDAVTQTPTAAGTKMNVLLADHTLTRVVGSGTSAPGSTFQVSQRFLAETAMIAAEAPNLARSVVVAPPREWDPSPALASQLLSETVNAPWLSPDSLAGLASPAASASPGTRQPPPDEQVSPSELSRSYLKQVGALDSDVRLFKNILFQPKAGYLARLSAGVAATESSAWRGRPAARQAGQTMLGRVTAYLTTMDHKVKIIDSSRVTLGGSSGKVPVSIANGLPESIQVRLQATGPPDSRLTVSGYPGLITVGVGQTETVRLSVRSGAVGDTTIQLRLLGRDGTALPGDPVSLNVQSTQFGTTLLVIIFVALGVLVLTAIARAIRRGLRNDQPATDQPGNTAERAAGGTAPAAGAANVDRDSHATDPRDPPEAPDDYAEARGWARYT
jgi:hypothetical protein